MKGTYLLVKCIKFLYEEDGGLKGGFQFLGGGVWKKSIGSINQLHENDVILSDFMVLLWEWGFG